MTTLKYVLRDMFRLLIHHWVLGLLTLITAGVMLWILGITTLFSLNLENLLLRLESELTVQAYLVRDNTLNIEEIAEKIQKLEYVYTMKIYSPSDSLAKLQEKMGSHSKALDMLGENPIPYNFEIHVHKAEEVEKLVEELRAMPEVDDIVYAGMVVRRISALSRISSRVALIMFILSVIITALVVYNTIHISLYSRREEIGIMYLVGATKSYIASPFVLEGTLLAFFGALIAVGGIIGTYFPGIILLQTNLPVLNSSLITDKNTIFRFCALLAGFGATLGWVCSYLVVSRFINSITRPE
ncbi:MAG: permease-like cell division protein FtsX [Synergistaceae bacterium]|nr:permease-like cell division protein FtsX [Synergistaceae bacterium]MBQ6738997.1 permease-like cell division protein FtsX [Synergistaceae bacterium]MBQ7068869.1 permease-like cell division protein FtsX [Synergistaceae bacterium]MBR0074489.1 permease-like cell division protein FtsX [Synergistaceae bacterium]MBR0080657.1 permease-like cell division protein FtsX [Synergistaceae bacterium]